MKLEVTQENLAKSLTMISRIVGVRSTLPVLNNVLLSTNKGRLSLSATDLEVGLITWTGAKIIEEGAFTVPAKLLNDLISQAADKTINISHKEGLLYVESGESRAEIKGITADEFPPIPDVKGASLLAIAPLLLKEALRKTVVAAAIDETRPALSGVLLWQDGAVLKVAATDSYRLAETKVKLPKGAETLKIIVPLRTAQELVRLLDSSDDEVTLSVSDNQALFKTSSFILVSRLIDGEFPNYADIIPKSGIATVSLLTDDLLRAIKLASLFAREIANHITLSSDGKGTLTVKASSVQVGENTTSLPADIKGEAVTVSFNGRFLVDAVSAIGSKNIELTLTGKTSPAVFREEGNQDFLHLVMPLRIEE